MFTDYNEEENEKITLKSQQEKIEKIAKKIGKISNEKTGIVSLVVMADKEGVFCSTKGSGNVLGKALLEICQQDEDFKRLIIRTATTLATEDLSEHDISELTKLANNKIARGSDNDLDLDKLDSDIKKEVKDKGISSFKTPDGDDALAIDPNKIDDLSDEDIDSIVDKMLKNKGISFGRKNTDDESE